jgi:hypothetical protein
MMEGVNSTMMYHKNFCKCHNVTLVNNKKIPKKRVVDDQY